MVFDGHSDLLYDVTCRRLAGEDRVLERYHLNRLRQGGIEGLALAFWYGTGQGHTFWKDVPGGEDEVFRFSRMLDCAQAELAQCPWLTAVRTAQEAEAARTQGQMYAFLCVEGLSALGRDLSGIDRLAERGVRWAMLTWNEENLLASGAAQDPQKGLTALGRQAVLRLEAQGMLVDVSHLNEGGFWQVLSLVHGPVIASHSNCRRLCDVPRNLSDGQLRAIRDTGGVVGLNTYHGFVHQNPSQQTAEMLARHAVHMIEVMGVEHVACGFDFCKFMGPPDNEALPDLEDASQIGNLFHWLERMGLSERERELIAWRNFLRVLQ